MFEIDFKEHALAGLEKIRPFHARQILDAIEDNLRFEPERTSRTRIKRLRGRQRAMYRLRVGDFRVFYDVLESVVSVVAVLHKDETPRFYEQGEEP
jgi:mRNA interferase RelE/StbE